MNTPILCAVAMSLAATAMLTAVGVAAACARDPSLPIAAACNETSTWQGPLRYKLAFQLCMETLRGTPESSPASAYSIVAAKAALESCAATERTAVELSQDPKLPETLRATYSNCVDLYGSARSNIDAISDALKTCKLGVELGRGCEDANAVNICFDKLRRVDSGSALYNMVLADRDRIILTCYLAALIPN